MEKAQHLLHKVIFIVRMDGLTLVPPQIVTLVCEGNTNNWECGSA